MHGVAEHNRQAWNSRGLASQYGRLKRLFPAEAAFLASVRDSLSGWDVLDLGIGSGRTTRHIAPLCRRYEGVDLSHTMIREAQRRFPHLSLRVGDASRLDEFRDGDFDLVLFSYNGLDYLDGEGRRNTLAEVSRVLRPNGCLLYSSHNALHLEALIQGERVSHGLLQLWQPFRRRLILRFNPGLGDRLNQDCLFVRDEAHRGRLLTCYSTPLHNLMLLHEAGLTFGLVYGLKGEPVGRDSRDAWLHYSARKPATP